MVNAVLSTVDDEWDVTLANASKCDFESLKRIPQYIRLHRFHKILLRHLREDLVLAHNTRIREHDV